MFCPPDLIIRGLRPRDVPEVYKMLNAALKDEEGAELKRQIRFIFMHPAIWILSGVLICVFGISLSIPPIPASIMGLIFVFMASKKRFQAEFWSDVQGFFRIRSEDIKEEARVRKSSEEVADKHSEGKKFFLVAELRGRVVGTVAVRESTGDDSSTCRLYWLCTHNACRRMGIASKLVAEALKVAGEGGGYVAARATASKNCTAATATLEKVGFEKTEETVIASAYPMSFSVNEYEMHLS